MKYLRTLYHGTSTVRAQQIYSEDRLRCAPYGDQHVSLSTSFQAAWYFAHMAASGDEGGHPVVLALDAKRLNVAGYEFMPFVSQCWEGCEWEREIAVFSDIHPLSDVLLDAVAPRVRT